MHSLLRVLALATLAIFGATASAFAQSIPVTLDSGTEIHAIMNAPIDTGTAHVGDRFSMAVMPPYPPGSDQLSGATITGTVLKVTPAGQGRNPELQLAFQTIELADGTTLDIDAQMTQVEQKSDGKNGAAVAAATGIGMIVGNIIGKTVFHSNDGGLIGAAGGFITGYNKKANMQVPQGSHVTVMLTHPLVVRRQARYQPSPTPQPGNVFPPKSV